MNSLLGVIKRPLEGLRYFLIKLLISILVNEMLYTNTVLVKTTPYFSLPRIKSK